MGYVLESTPQIVFFGWLRGLKTIHVCSNKKTEDSSEKLLIITDYAIENLLVRSDECGILSEAALLMTYVFCRLRSGWSTVQIHYKTSLQKITI